MGKRFSESAAKKAAGMAKKRENERIKERAQRERDEAEEAAKWSQGTSKRSEKKILEEQKRQEKLKAKQEREASFISC